MQSNPCSMSDAFLIYGPPEDEITSAGTDDISKQTRPNDISKQNRLNNKHVGCGKMLAYLPHNNALDACDAEHYK